MGGRALGPERWMSPPPHRTEPAHGLARDRASGGGCSPARAVISSVRVNMRQQRALLCNEGIDGAPSAS